MSEKLGAGVDLAFAQLGQSEVDEPDSLESAAPALNGVSGRVCADRQMSRFPRGGLLAPFPL